MALGLREVLGGLDSVSLVNQVAMGLGVEVDSVVPLQQVRTVVQEGLALNTRAQYQVGVEEQVVVEVEQGQTLRSSLEVTGVTTVVVGVVTREAQRGRHPAGLLGSSSSPTQGWRPCRAGSRDPLWS